MKSCEQAVAEKIMARREVGLKKYGVGVAERTDLTLREWLIHTQEELMDACVYLEKLIREEPTP